MHPVPCFNQCMLAVHTDGFETVDQRHLFPTSNNWKWNGLRKCSLDTSTEYILQMVMANSCRHLVGKETCCGLSYDVLSLEYMRELVFISTWNLSDVGMYSVGVTSWGLGSDGFMRRLWGTLYIGLVSRVVMCQEIISVLASWLINGKICVLWMGNLMMLCQLLLQL